MSYKEERIDYLSSKEYSSAMSILPFCRLWCIVELYSAKQAQKPIFFRVCSAAYDVEQEALVIATEGGFYTLLNFSNMVDLELAACAVVADRDREMSIIRASGTGNSSGVTTLEKAVKASLAAGSTSVKLGMTEVDAFVCGEPEALHELPKTRVVDAVTAAASAGLNDVLGYLLTARKGDIGDPASLWEPVWLAAASDHADTIEVLLRFGFLADAPDAKMGRTPLWKAALNGHARVVSLLMAWGADPSRAKPSDGSSPLYVASEFAHVNVVRLLLGSKLVLVDSHRISDGMTPLHAAVKGGHGEVAELLLAAGANPNRRAAPAEYQSTDMSGGKPAGGKHSGWTPLFFAANAGYRHVVELLLNRGAVAEAELPWAHSGFEAGITALQVAESKGHVGVAAELQKHATSTSYYQHSG